MPAEKQTSIELVLVVANTVFVYLYLKLQSFHSHSRSRSHSPCLRITTTLSPRRNIFDTYLSLVILFCDAFFADFLAVLSLLGVSDHTSLTFSSTMLQWRSNAFTLATSLWLFLSEISTVALFCTACASTRSGPLANCAVSYASSSSAVICSFGLSVKCDIYAVGGDVSIGRS